MRSRLAWVAVLSLAFACFAPWTEVTTCRAALGLLARATWLTRYCAAAAAVLSVLVMYESPGTMLQFGYEAHATWGGFLALASSLALLPLARARARAPVPPRSGSPTP